MGVNSVFCKDFFAKRLCWWEFYLKNYLMLSSREKKNNKTILVSSAPVVEKLEKHHEVICYSTFKQSLWIHVTKVEVVLL